MADVLVLGAGYTGAAVMRLASPGVVGVVRTARAGRPELVVAPVLTPEVVAPFASEATRVVVTFPPDGVTDARVAPALARAASIAYVSSTGVYGPISGVIDDSTPVRAGPDARLAAEATWRAVGATVLRAPAIYGPDRGIHRRIVKGEFRIVGDGSTFTSRIHVDDLARLLLAVSPAVRGETFVVGDLQPATQREVATWVAAEWGVPFPGSIPAAEAHETLRGSRRVDPSRALRVLGVELKYPNYRSGMANTGPR